MALGEVKIPERVLWYTKHESPLRMGIWHAGNIISNVISGLLAAGILENMDDVGGLHSWQWFLLLEGIVSIMVAIAGFWLLPNWPNNTGTYYFTPEESQMAQWRQMVSAGGKSEDEEGDYWSGFVMAMKDPFTWGVCRHALLPHCGSVVQGLLPIGGFPH